MTIALIVGAVLISTGAVLYLGFYIGVRILVNVLFPSLDTIHRPRK